MNKWMRTTVAGLASLALCAVFGTVLLVYAKPFSDQTYSLAMTWETEAMPDGWVYDQKGWTVFTQEGEAFTELTADGYGGFSGMESPGETFYFSRTMEEALNCPTLRLTPGETAIAIFLDGALLYTDCPELDNRVGYLHLPTLEWDRTEPVMVPLPGNYLGKTLTVAQATYPEWETDSAKVYPIALALYSSYAYESGLIAESFRTAVPTSLAFAAGGVLLFLLVLQTFRGTPDMSTVCGALLAFFWLAGRLAQTSFAHLYFSMLPVDLVTLCWDLCLTLLLVFLSSHLTGRWSIVPWGLTIIQGLMVLASLILQITQSMTLQFVQAASGVGLIGLLAALVCGVGEWKRGSWFYRWFCLLTGIGIALWIAAAVSTPSAVEIWQQFTMGAAGYFLWRLMLPAAVAALVTAIAGAVRSETARWAQARLLSQRFELTQDSYEAMRRQHEQVMMLRHDMAKHLRLLRQMTADPKTQRYLDELLGDTEKIRSVVQSGNEMLDIILNSKLSAAADAGIAVELMRAQAPPRLPLSDAELCSLVVNLMDNALEAAGAPGLEHPYIKLDLHIKNDFFAFTCENSITPEWLDRETAPGHGLGLEIVRQIVTRHGNLTKTEYGRDFYRVAVVLPLRQPLK